jgi:hypothetical protein
MHRNDLLAVAIIAGLLSACSPTSGAGPSASVETGAATSSDNYVWARSDGALDMPTFSRCMEASGYVRMG